MATNDCPVSAPNIIGFEIHAFLYINIHCYTMIVPLDLQPSKKKY